MRTRTGRRVVPALLGLVALTAFAAAGPGDAAAPPSPWPVMQHDAQHTGRADVAGPARYVAERCTADLGGSEMGAPVVGSDGTVYVASGGSDDPSGDWRLHALNPDCSPAWSLPLPGWPGRTVPAVGPDGTIYVHTNGPQNIAGPPHLVAVHPDGTEAWDLPYRGELAALATGTPSPPVVAEDGRIWFGSTSTWLFAVDPAGEIACAVQSPTVSSIDTAPAIAADGTVYVLDITNELMAVDPSCALDWSRGLQPSSATMDSTIAIGPGERVYVSANDELVALSSSGTELWRVAFDGPVSTPAVGPDGTVYVESDGLAAVTPTGTVTWDGRSCLDWTRMSGGRDDPPVVDADGVVYHQQNGAQKVVCAFGPDGSRLWRLEREFGTAGGRLAIAGDGALLDGEGGGFGTPPRLGIIEPAARADVRIARGQQPLVGDDVVNGTGSRQTAVGTASPGRSVTYTVSAQNDAQFADRLTLRGQGSTATFVVRYRSPSGLDITSAVTGGSYRTATLGPGAAETIRVTVTVRRSARPGDRVARTVTARSVADPTTRDTVRSVTKVG